MKFNKVKRIIAAGVTLVMTACLITGCGADKTADLDTTVINIWTGDAHSKTVVQRLIDKFNETTGKEKKIKIEYTVQGNIGNVLEVSMNSNQGPELFASGGLQKYVENGWVKAIEDMPGGTEFLKNYNSDDLKSYQIDGKTYKVPFYVTTFGIMYNKDLFKEYGVVDENGEAKPPRTLDEFRETAKTLTHPDKMQYGLIVPLKGNDLVNSAVVYPAMASHGKFIYDPVDGKYDFSCIKDNMECMLGIKNDKSMFPSAESLDNDAARAQFAEGNIGMIFSGCYDYGVMTTQFHTDCDWGVAQIPVEDPSNAYMQRMASDGYLYINNNKVNDSNAEKIMEVYKWFQSDEMLEELYRAGVALPYNYEKFKDIELSEDMTQWKEYFDLLKTSHVIPEVMPFDLRGGKSYSEIIKQEVWTENISVDDAIDDLNRRYNEGVDVYFSNNPKYPKDHYVDKGWDISLNKN
ncbi:MAG: ABC transporter substrate-binding protein [Monoglobaceae bacterium]